MGALWVSKDSNELILFPIENMIEKLNSIIRDPIIFRNENEILSYTGPTKKVLERKNELYYVDEAMNKIAVLLCMVYGEAGGKIISDSLLMANEQETYLWGRKQNMVFGFVEIRNFGEIIEVLQTEIVTFANIVADILHGEIDAFFGQANKNLGSEF